MTNIDFYILAEQQDDERYLFACRLAEKAFNSRCQVHIHCQDQSQAQMIDKLLWEFRQSSFIPHSLLENDKQAPVTLGYGQQLGEHFDVLINLADDVPQHFARYQRVLEVVIQQDQVLNMTREHYKFYKERGYPMSNTDMRV